MITESRRVVPLDIDPLNIHVCIKQVPDVTAPEGSDRTVLNAYDASAVEECLVLREKYGGQVNVVLIGPPSATETIRKALAMGADAAVHLVAEDLSSWDSFAFATALAGHFRDTPFDFIACGKQAQDTDAGLTGSMLAEMLGIPFATNAVGLDIDGGVLVTRQGDSGREIIHLPTPCLVTCSNDMNDPRLPTLKGIMASKKKPVESRTVESPDSMTEFVGYEPSRPRQPGQLLQGEPDEVAAELVGKLRDEAKIL